MLAVQARALVEEEYVLVKAEVCEVVLKDWVGLNGALWLVDVEGSVKLLNEDSISFSKGTTWSNGKVMAKYRELHLYAPP